MTAAEEAANGRRGDRVGPPISSLDDEDGDGEWQIHIGLFDGTVGEAAPEEWEEPPAVTENRPM